ncbi:ribonuclease H-like domain-containing protein [Tanacetum coccineum]
MGHTTQSGQTTFPHQLTTHSTQSTSGPNNVQQPTRTHPMVTRAQVGTVKPNPHFYGHTSHISHLYKSHDVALSDSNWRGAMYDEYNALIRNSTWILIPKPPNANVVRSMWLFRQKYHADGSLSSLVVKPSTIHIVLSLALSHNWPIYQLDVKNAFLNGDLSETVYMHLVLGFNGLLDMHYELASSTRLLQHIISFLHKEFDMTDLGALNYFLGILVTRDSTGMFLSQKKYTMKLLDRAHMASCNPTRTPVDTKSKLGADGDPISDPTLYRSLADFGLQLYASSTSSLVAYFDADWAGCLTTRRFTSGYCVFFEDNLLSWSCKRQHTLSRSSAEAEYRGVANVVAETTWLRNLLRELHMPLLYATLVYCDNVSAIYLTANPVQHQRTKHIEIDIHFVRDMVARGHVHVLHVPSRYQYADIFTKGLASALFEEFRSSLNVRSSPTPTAGEC